jgi:Spy/CpxP family protein refolding chaperone
MARLWLLVGIVVMTAAAIGCSRTDAAITTQVKNRLAVDESTKAYQIGVTTVDRVVTLTGAVDSTAKSKALTLTRETAGVGEVVDQLAVNSSTGQPLGAGLNDASAGGSERESEMPMQRSEMGMPPDGMPGVPHLYHIGSTGFFLNQPRIRLTADQQSTLNQIREGALLERADADRRLERAEQELWALTGAGTDIAEVEGKVTEIEKIRANQRIGFIRAVGEAIEALTPEQRMALPGVTSATK